MNREEFEAEKIRELEQQTPTQQRNIRVLNLVVTGIHTACWMGAALYGWSTWAEGMFIAWLGAITHGLTYWLFPRLFEMRTAQTPAAENAYNFVCDLLAVGGMLSAGFYITAFVYLVGNMGPQYTVRQRASRAK